MNRLQKVLFGLAVTLLGGALSRGSVSAETLYIFYPSTIRPLVIQQKMTEACPGIEIRVFGRFKDFETEVATGKPDAILTKYPVIQQIGGYSVVLKGSRKGETEESNVLLSVNEKVDPNTASGITIGMFDILGREGMKQMIGSRFKGDLKLRLVSKMEDLLPLLTFNMANAILLSENQIGYFRELSNLNLMTTPVPSLEMGIVALATKSNGSTEMTLRAFTGMNDESMAMLEVDKWVR